VYLYVDSPCLLLWLVREEICLFLLPRAWCWLAGRANRADNGVSLKAHVVKHVKAIPVDLQKHFCMSAILRASTVEISQVSGCMLAGKNVQ